MDSVLAEQHHKFHHFHQLHLGKKSLREIDIPPRKLLSRRAAAAAAAAAAAGSSDHMFLDSPKLAHDEALLYKFLSCNTVDDDDDDGDADPYSSDHFRMYEFKVRKCTRSRSHDWTDCPFAHPGEKARRRDPRRYHYSGTICSEFRRGSCSRGDNCEFAHGVFECWLHPSRYRTEACKDGKNCKRKICFFAHTARQLRVLPVDSPPAQAEKKGRNQCCIYCHSVTASPTSTLMGMSHISPPLSPSLTPPLSPVKAAGFSPSSRYGGAQFSHGGALSYKDTLTELMNSIEAMHMSEMSPAAVAARSGRNNNHLNLPWLDVNFSGEEQPQYMISPSTPSPGINQFMQRRLLFEDNKYNIVDQNGSVGPDFEWVDDLLT